MAEPRSLSMVEQHALKQQQLRQQSLVSELSRQFPSRRTSTLSMALSLLGYSTFDITGGQSMDAKAILEASSLLKAFFAERDRLKQHLTAAGLQKNDDDDKVDLGRELEEQRSSRARENSDAHDEHGGGGRSHKRRRHHHRRHHSSGKRSRSPSPTNQHAGAGTGTNNALTGQYGKYGVIHAERDADNKRTEFSVWATEIKEVNVENLSRWEWKELFKEYVEDYNTATLAHVKYYDLEAHARREKEEKQTRRERRARRRARGEQVSDDSDEEPNPTAAFGGRADEDALRLQRRADEEARRRNEVDRLRFEMRYTGKAEDMKNQEELRRAMDLAYRTGDLAKARDIAKRLEADEPTRVVRGPGGGPG